MLFFIGTIITASSLGFIFKWFEKNNIDVFQAIVVNYFVCVIVGSLFTQKLPFSTEIVHSNWFPYAIGLGLFFITGFNINALCVLKRGVTLTTIVQKMSFILSVLFAFIYFKESITIFKIIAIILAVGAIIFSNWNTESDATTAGKKDKSMFLFLVLPLLVFTINGIIESTLQFVQLTKLNGSGGLDFSISLFGIAGILGLIIMLIGIMTGRLKFESKNIIGGILLGIPNFFSIYLLLETLGLGWEGSIVFPFINVSVISISAIIETIFFKKKSNIYTRIGFALALLSITFIALEQWSK